MVTSSLDVFLKTISDLMFSKKFSQIFLLMHIDLVNTMVV